MGVAAYNRGTKALQDAIDRERPTQDMQLLRDLSAFSLRHGGRVLFQATVVRFGPSVGEVSLMNREQRGWGERSYTYDSLWSLARCWKLVFIGFGVDAHSRFARVAPSE